MKIFYLSTAIAVFLVLFFSRIQGQNVSTNLDQVKLAQVSFVGTWQRNISKDTIEVSECSQYGNAFIQNVYLVINGKKSFSYILTYGYSSKEGKFKGYFLYPSGYYGTWLASFTSEKKWSGDFVRNFNPEAITGKFETVLENPTSMTMIFFNSSGVKTREFKYSKVK